MRIFSKKLLISCFCIISLMLSSCKNDIIKSSSSNSSSKSSSSTNSLSKSSSSLTSKVSTSAISYYYNEYTSVDEVFNEFLVEFKRCDVEKLMNLAKIYNDPEELIAFKNLEVDNVTYKSLEKEEQYATYEITFNVKKVENPPFKLGTNTYILVIKDIPYRSLGVDYFIKKENYISDKSINELLKNPAVDLIEYIKTIKTQKPFKKTSELDKDILIENVIFLASKDSTTNEQYFSQEEINKVAQKYYGVNEIIDTNSYLFDKDKNKYFAGGRGGIYNDKQVITKVQEDTTNNKTIVFYDVYKDGLSLNKDHTEKWTLTKNVDGSYKFVSFEIV